MPEDKRPERRISDERNQIKSIESEQFYEKGSFSRQGYSDNDEIDLVDILSVIFKRRWLIVWIVAISFIFSFIYVRLFTSPRYKTSIRIQLPQVYRIDDDNSLQPTDYDPSEFIYSIKGYFNDLLNRQKDDIGVKATGYSLSVKGSQINVTISNSDVKRISGIVNDLYGMYSETLVKINKKNNDLYNLSEETIQKTIEEKKSIMNRVTLALEEELLKEYPPEFNTAMEILSTLSFEVINLEKIENLNKNVELRKGFFEVIGKPINGKENSMIIDNSSDLNNVTEYIYPEKSRKRQYLPVVVAIFLGFFVGIFLAFVVEFFSREDVRTRLGDAIKKKPRVNGSVPETTSANEFPQD